MAETRPVPGDVPSKYFRELGQENEKSEEDDHGLFGQVENVEPADVIGEVGGLDEEAAGRYDAGQKGDDVESSDDVQNYSVYGCATHDEFGQEKPHGRTDADLYVPMEIDKSFYAHTTGRYLIILDVEEQGQDSISGTKSTKIGMTLSRADNGSHSVFVIGDLCGSLVIFVRHDTPPEPAFNETVYRGPSSRTKGNKVNKTRVGRDKDMVARFVRS